jgi:hypothetical protein
MKRNKYKVTGMNLGNEILNHYISSFFPFFAFLFFFEYLQAKLKKKKYYHGSNTSGSQELKEHC